jgi:hypothetical protein
MIPPDIQSIDLAWRSGIASASGKRSEFESHKGHKGRVFRQNVLTLLFMNYEW